MQSSLQGWALLDASACLFVLLFFLIFCCCILIKRPCSNPCRAGRCLTPSLLHKRLSWLLVHLSLMPKSSLHKSFTSRRIWPGEVCLSKGGFGKEDLLASSGFVAAVKMHRLSLISLHRRTWGKVLCNEPELQLVN